VCGNSARTDLGGGRLAMTVPTAIGFEFFAFDPSGTFCRRPNALNSKQHASGEGELA
jgi:hypothetical protein